uniref:Myotubularin-related protein 12 n=1 Tax=Oncorhynchus tshawytscha TaxID=74940 RepID=A0AAZ3SP34_ONCTS
MFDGRVLLKQVILLFWPLISTWVQGAEKIDSCQLQVLEMLSSLGSAGGKSAKPSFVSYVTPEEIKSEKEPSRKEKHPDLLPGEVVFCSASTVLKYTQDDLSQRGVFGVLLCTNFRVSFVSDEEPTEEMLFKNKLYGENDIPLSCVDNIYGDKRKLITGGLVKNKYPSKMIIHCKDLRVFQFSLSFSKEEDAKKIFQGIVHHCLEPKSLRCLFAFSYCENTSYPGSYTVENTSKKQTVMFDSVEDWTQDMKRTKGNCRVVSENSNFELSPKMLTAVAHNHLYSVKTEDLSDTLPTVQDILLSYNKFKQFFLIDNTTEFWMSDMKWFSSLDNCGWLDIIRQCLQKAVEVVESLEKENTNVLIMEEGGSDLCCVVSSLVQLMLDPYYRTLLGFQSLVQKEWVAGGHAFLDRSNHLHLKDKVESPVFLLFLECVWQLQQQHGPAFQFSETYLTVLSDSVHVPVFTTFLFNNDGHRDSLLRAESPHTQRSPLNCPTVWDWSVQFDCKAQDLFTNPLYTEKPKQDTSVRKSYRPRHLRQLSLPSSAFKTPPKKGFFKDEADNLKKILGVKRLSRWMLSPSSDSPQTSSSVREFYEAWQTKPLDYHGLLLPCLDGPSIRVWMQRYLRWIHDVQILGGGPVAMLSKVSEILGEVQELQRQLDRHGCTLTSNHKGARPRAKTAAAVIAARSSVRLSSSFPFVTSRNWAFKPAIPTSLLQSLMVTGMPGNLADREDDGGPESLV